MKSTKIDGKIVEVKKIETVKEEAEIEEQVVKLSAEDGEINVTLKGPAGFLADIIVEAGEVKTKLDVRLELKRVEKPAEK